MNLSTEGIQMKTAQLAVCGLFVVLVSLLGTSQAQAQKAELLCEVCKAACSTLASEACGGAASLMCSTLDLDQKTCKKVGELACDIGTSAIDNAYDACGGLCTEIDICTRATVRVRSRPSHSASASCNSASSCLREGKAMEEYELYEDAIPLFERACQKGSATGCLRAAFIQDAPRKRPRVFNEARATQLYYEACTLGSKGGCYNLGHQFEKGLGGLNPDRNIAQSHYKTACRKGHRKACEKRRDLCDEGVTRACR